MRLELEIIFENDHFIVINKPAGLLSIPDREGTDISLKQILKDKYGNIFTVHRLDRETSGVIIFAKDEVTHQYLSVAFEERNVEKYYIGIVNGTISEKTGTIDAPIAENMAKRGVMLIHKRGKEAVTDYEVLETFGKFSHVRFRIHTGRTHQIRVHMQSIGHPIVCDPIYGDGQPVLLSSFKHRFKLSKSEEEERPMLARMGLHAQQLKLKDAQGKKHDFEATPPKDIRALLQQLRKVKR